MPDSTDTEFQIKRGIPIPNKNKPRATKYPLAAMQIGDCFDVSLGAADMHWLEADVAASSVRNVAAYHAKKHDKKFAVKVLREGTCFARVWRTA